MLKYNFKELNKPVVIDEPAIADVIITNNNRSVSVTVTTAAGLDETRLNTEEGEDIRFTAQIGNVEQILFGGTDNWGYYKLIIQIENEVNAVQYDSILVNNITVDPVAGENDWCRCELIDENTLKYTAISKNTSSLPRYAIFRHKTTDKIISGGESAGRPAAPEWYVTVMQEGTDGQQVEPTPSPTPDPTPTPDPQPDPTPEDLGELKYKVGIISDVHFDTDNNVSKYQEDMVNAMNYFRQNNVSFIANIGDSGQGLDTDLIYDNDTQTEVVKDSLDYYEFYLTYNNSAYAPTGGNLRLFTCIGNHDYWYLYTRIGKYKSVIYDPNIQDIVPIVYNDTSDDNVEIGTKKYAWNSFTGEEHNDIKFFEYDGVWNLLYVGNRNNYSKLSYYIEKEGDIYVFLSLDYGEVRLPEVWGFASQAFNKIDMQNEYTQRILPKAVEAGYNSINDAPYDYQFYHPNKLTWLWDILENNKNKRIFIFTHHYLTHKVGGGTSYSTNDWYYSKNRLYPYTNSTDVSTTTNGSNTLCGIEFYFLNWLNNTYKNTFWFSGHTHTEWASDLLDPYINFCNKDFNIFKPTNVHDSKFYTRQSDTPIGTSAWNIHIPSLSRPESVTSGRRNAASEGGIMEVYENGIKIIPIQFKKETDSNYTNTEYNEGITVYNSTIFD